MYSTEEAISATICERSLSITICEKEQIKLVVCLGSSASSTEHLTQTPVLSCLMEDRVPLYTFLRGKVCCFIKADGQNVSFSLPEKKK